MINAGRLQDVSTRQEVTVLPLYAVRLLPPHLVEKQPQMLLEHRLRAVPHLPRNPPVFSQVLPALAVWPSHPHLMPDEIPVNKLPSVRDGDSEARRKEQEGD